MYLFLNFIYKFRFSLGQLYSWNFNFLKETLSFMMLTLFSKFRLLSRNFTLNLKMTYSFIYFFSFCGSNPLSWSRITVFHPQKIQIWRILIFLFERIDLNSRVFPRKRDNSEASNWLEGKLGWDLHFWRTRYAWRLHDVEPSDGREKWRAQNSKGQSLCRPPQPAASSLLCSDEERSDSQD